MTEMEAQKQKNKKESCQCRETQQCAFGEQWTKKKKKSNIYQRPAMCAINHALLAVISGNT